MTQGDLLTYLSFLVALTACYAVGVMVTLRAFSQGVGWAFLGLAASLAWSAFVDTYAAVALARPGDLPGGELMATFSDTSFVAWFLFLALVLEYTPTARDAIPGGRWLPLVTVSSAVVFQVAALLRSTHLDAPYEDLVSPWAVPALAGPAG